MTPANLLLAAAILSVTFAIQAMAAEADALPAEPNEQLFGSRIQRTMTLLATSTEAQRNPVKILFYGQSIVRQDYVRKVVEADLRRRFPYAEIVTANRAIGGYEGPSLVRTAVHDLYPFYPDLVVFHVYNGEFGGEFERIVSNIRRYTTAEILTWTHHLDNFGEARDKERDEDSAFRRGIAQKYDCELVDLRPLWQQFLQMHNLQRQDLLVDGIHLKPRGGQVMGRLVLRHFRFNPLFPCGWANTVRTYEARRALEEATDEITFSREGWRRTGAGVVGASKASALRLRFHGNRVDVVAMPAGGKLGTARVLVDGKPPSAFIGSWAATLPSPTPIDYRPALKRVTLGGQPLAEDWTLTVTRVSDDGQQFAYQVEGSKTGPDGAGTHEKTFVSKSGRLRIEPQDFSFREAISIRKKPLPATFKVTWSVYLMGSDTYAPQPFTDVGKVDRYTVVQGIPNAEHQIEIIPNGDGIVPVKEIVVYRPPLE